jgi:hypothetical protein
MQNEKKKITLKVADQERWFPVSVQKDPPRPKRTLFDLFQRAVGK